MGPVFLIRIDEITRVVNNTGSSYPGQLTSKSISISMDESALISAEDVVAKTDGNSFWIDQILDSVPIIRLKMRTTIKPM